MAEDSTSAAANDRSPEPGERRSESPRQFTLWQRVQIAAASLVGYLTVLIVGRTLRCEIYGKEHWEEEVRRGKGYIATFCHNQIFLAIWFWRRRGMVVLTSQNFDGEYITRIIQRHGFGAVRGSSSRGGGRALLEMIRCVRAGSSAVITVDGPRGPRFVAKPGVVLLARATGAAILCFHFAVRPAFVFRKSWDQTEFPYPFARAAAFIAPPIVISPDAAEAEQEANLQEVQRTLDELRARGEEWTKRIR